MKTHKIHFDVAVDRDSVRNAWCAFLLGCVEHAVLPRIMYETGRSKREALKRDVDILDGKKLAQFMHKVQNIKGLPGFYLGSLWAEVADGSKTYHVSFTTNPRRFQMPCFVIVDVSDEDEAKLYELLNVLAAEKQIRCVDCVLAPAGGVILEARESQKSWSSDVSNPAEFKKLKKRVSNGAQPKGAFRKMLAHLGWPGGN